LTPRQLTNFRLDAELLDALRAIKDRDGIPIAEQVRRALETWVESKGVKVKADRKRAGTRKRS
jgi:Ribbon-helix-helix protein, copG family